MTLPTTPWATEALALLRASVSEPVANHSVRAFLFADLLAGHWDVRGRYDPEALFYATVLHDIGLSRRGAERPDRFEVAGADIAAEFLQDNGVAQETVDDVWEAIALHTSAGISSRRGLVCRLTAAGTALDFGVDSEFVTDEVAAGIHAEYPRLGTGSTLHTEILGQAKENPAKAPLASLAHLFLVTESTDDEILPARWGD
ncbi:HD domain-containing protein [Umezawaea endophytica]|uniref:HD domain-containing protein n=1 Tax=Umezawaea endophytica TaxID=1654476 RepID=A0A9X2VL10_9PSEU|nr:HD domain-containing protein [Umezawaea endophytica]MCS7478451.1 HD domain-containing protein [Umezawaea endophytica]